MKNEYTYKNGLFEKSDTLPEWEEGESFESWNERAGYKENGTKFGMEINPGLEIYTKKDNEHQFLAECCPLGNEVFSVIIPDFPSLMMFLRDFGNLYFPEL